MKLTWTAPVTSWKAAIRREAGSRGSNLILTRRAAGSLIADGYDAGGQPVKEFSLHGSSFKKVNGHWRLERWRFETMKNLAYGIEI